MKGVIMKIVSTCNKAVSFIILLLLTMLMLFGCKKYEPIEDMPIKDMPIEDIPTE